eukprot:GEMP01002175.1.p1 GENE.GEMP01002175.1~~GEMP01002175.1.p1  ORF type:complete len:1209 (+),score=275.31 GEMP01002175.1:44-3670(+)
MLAATRLSTNTGVTSASAWSMPPVSVLASYKLASFTDSHPSVVDPPAEALPPPSYDSLTRDDCHPIPVAASTFNLPAYASQLTASTRASTSFTDAQPSVVDPPAEALSPPSYDTLTLDGCYPMPIVGPAFNLPAYASQLAADREPMTNIAPRECTRASFRPANKRTSSNQTPPACSAPTAAFSDPSVQLLPNVVDCVEAEHLGLSSIISTFFHPSPSVTSPRHAPAYHVPSSPSSPFCAIDASLSPPHRPHDSIHAIPSSEDCIPLFGTIRRVDPSMTPVHVRRRRGAMRPLYNAITGGHSGFVHAASAYSDEDAFHPQSGIDRRRASANDTVPRFTPLACNVATGVGDDDVGGRQAFATQPTAWPRMGAKGSYELCDVAPVDVPFRPLEPTENLCLFAPDLRSKDDFGADGVPIRLEAASQAASEAFCDGYIDMSAPICQRSKEMSSRPEDVAGGISTDHAWQSPVGMTTHSLLLPRPSMWSANVPNDLSFHATPSSAREQFQSATCSIHPDPVPPQPRYEGTAPLDDAVAASAAMDYSTPAASCSPVFPGPFDHSVSRCDLAPTIFFGAPISIANTEATKSVPHHPEPAESIAGTILPWTVLPAVRSVVGASIDMAIAVDLAAAVSSPLISGPSVAAPSICTPRTTGAASAAHPVVTARAPTASTQMSRPVLVAAEQTTPTAPLLTEPPVTRALFLPPMPSSSVAQAPSICTPRTTDAASVAHSVATAGAPTASTQMSPPVLVAAAQTTPTVPSLTQPPAMRAPFLPPMPSFPVAHADPVLSPRTTAASVAYSVATAGAHTASAQTSRTTLVAAAAQTTPTALSLSQPPAKQALVLPPAPPSPVTQGLLYQTARSNSWQPATVLADRGALASGAWSPQRGSHVVHGTGYPQQGRVASPILISSRDMTPPQLGSPSSEAVRGLKPIDGSVTQKSADSASSALSRVARPNDNRIHATRHHVNQPTDVTNQDNDDRIAPSAPSDHCIQGPHYSPINRVPGILTAHGAWCDVSPSVRRASTADNNVDAAHCLVNRLNGAVTPFIATCDACLCVVFDGVAYNADSLLQLASLHAATSHTQPTSHCHMIMDRELIVSIPDIAQHYRAANRSPRSGAHQLDAALPSRVMEAALRLLSNERRTDRYRRILECGMRVVICRDGFLWPCGTRMHIVEVGWCAQGDEMGPAVMTVDEAGHTYILDADGANLSYVEIR